MFPRSGLRHRARARSALTSKQVRERPTKPLEALDSNRVVPVLGLEVLLGL
jgi:hypothetical protein